MTEGREAAVAELRRLAAGVRERGEAEAMARLLERVTAAGDPERLRAALAEVGAAAILQRRRARRGRKPGKAVGHLAAEG